MVNLHVATITGEETVLEQAAVEAFKISLRGELLCPDDAGYDNTRKVYNGMIDRRPQLIATSVQCPILLCRVCSIPYTRQGCSGTGRVIL
jgi:hypothetical protein